MEWKIGNVTIKNQVVLAPIAGVSNEAYRRIAKRFNVGLVYAEMVSDKGLGFQNQKTLSMLNVHEDEHPISMQIFGSEIETLVSAAKLVDQTNADIIDINMGCPVNKVAKANAGAALMKDPEKIYQIVKAVVESVKKPVTVKIRSGWDCNSINAVLVAKLIEKAGASAIAIHGRTRSQFYTGNADWNIIKSVKESVKIPVIGNGDIRSKEDALRMLEETKCDAVMIGRASQGNPWLLGEIVSYLDNRTEVKRPCLAEIKQTILDHIEMLKALKCEKLAVLEMRSQAAWYVKGFRNNTAFKQELCKVKEEKELVELIRKYFDYLEGLD